MYTQADLHTTQDWRETCKVNVWGDKQGHREKVACVRGRRCFHSCPPPQPCSANEQKRTGLDGAQGNGTNKWEGCFSSAAAGMRFVPLRYLSLHCRTVVARSHFRWKRLFACGLALVLSPSGIPPPLRSFFCTRILFLSSTSTFLFTHLHQHFLATPSVPSSSRTWVVRGCS